MSGPGIGHNNPPGLTDEQKRLAHDLIGSCTMSNPEWLEDLIENGSKLALEEFDAIVFECTACGWWCGEEEKNDINAQWYCDDCAEDQEES